MDEWCQPLILQETGKGGEKEGGEGEGEEEERSEGRGEEIRSNDM